MFVQTLTIDKLLCTFYILFIHYAKLILTRKLIYEYLKIKKVLPVAQKKRHLSPYLTKLDIFVITQFVISLTYHSVISVT
jgi:hypothetical protein